MVDRSSGDENDIPIARSSYPNNSHKARDEAGKPKVERVTTGEVVKRKKPLGRKIVETFAGGDDIPSVGNFILFDVAIPAIKTLIADSFSEGVQRLMFGGEYRGKRQYGSRPVQGFTNYSRFSSPVGRAGQADESTRTISQRARAAHDFDEIVLDDRGEAEAVLDQLQALIDQYDMASVDDLYNMVGITGTFADNKWGWFDLRGSGIVRVREGYLLNLPRTTPLDGR